MPWLKDVCEDIICGGSLGVVKGVFGVSLQQKQKKLTV